MEKGKIQVTINPSELFLQGIPLPESDGAVGRMRKSLDEIVFASENSKQDTNRIMQSIADKLHQKYNPDPGNEDVRVEISNKRFSNTMTRADALNLQRGIQRMSNNGSVRRILASTSNAFDSKSTVYAMQATFKGTSGVENQVISQITLTYILESYEDPDKTGGVVRMFISNDLNT